MKKKLVSLLLTVVLCLIPVAAYAIGIDLDPKVPGGDDTGTLVGKVNKVLGVVGIGSVMNLYWIRSIKGQMW